MPIGSFKNLTPKKRKEKDEYIPLEHTPEPEFKFDEPVETKEKTIELPKEEVIIPEEKEEKPSEFKYEFPKIDLSAKKEADTLANKIQKQLQQFREMKAPKTDINVINRLTNKYKEDVTKLQDDRTRRQFLSGLSQIAAGLVGLQTKLNIGKITPLSDTYKEDVNELRTQLQTDLTKIDQIRKQQERERAVKKEEIGTLVEEERMLRKKISPDLAAERLKLDAEKTRIALENAQKALISKETKFEDTEDKKQINILNKRLEKLPIKREIELSTLKKDFDRRTGNIIEAIKTFSDNEDKNESIIDSLSAELKLLGIDPKIIDKIKEEGQGWGDIDVKDANEIATNYIEILNQYYTSMLDKTKEKHNKVKLRVGNVTKSIPIEAAADTIEELIKRGKKVNIVE